MTKSLAAIQPSCFQGAVSIVKVGGRRIVSEGLWATLALSQVNPSGRFDGVLKAVISETEGQLMQSGAHASLDAGSPGWCRLSLA